MKYILLMRHGEHEAAGPSDSPIRRLTNKGKSETAEVAGRLASVIAELSTSERNRIAIASIWTATTEEVRKTEEVVRKELKGHLPCETEPKEAFDPTEFGPYENTGAHTHLSRALKELASTLSGGNAILAIGHQPLLGWLAGELTARRMPAFIRKGTERAIPIARSELICIAFEDGKDKKLSRGHLRWVLSPHSQEAIDDLKEKIKSKMDIAKVLSVFITTALTLLLGLLVDQDKVNYTGEHMWAIYVSAGLFFVSVALYMATMYAYDRLLMPIRFWGQTPPPKDTRKRPKWLVWRPPSSALWVLYQNMIRVWRYLFTGATYSVILGLLFLAYGVFKVRNPLIFFGFALLGLIFFMIYHKYFGPRLGTED